MCNTSSLCNFDLAILILNNFNYSRLKGQFQGQAFLANEARNVCNTFFHGILIEKSNYSIILVFQGHLQGQF